MVSKSKLWQSRCLISSRKWWGLTNTVCVSSPALFIRTAACQPAEPKQGGGVCWGPGVRKVRAASMKIRWADLKWMQERASPASQGHGFSARKRRLLEQETQPDRTRKPRLVVTRDGHKCRGRSRTPAPPFPPFIPHPSPSTELHACLQKAKRRCLNQGGFQLNSDPRGICGSLMLLEILKEASEKS